MLRTDRALVMSVTVTVLSWLAAGVATSWVVLAPHLHYAPVYLLWLHSFAIAATINTVVLVALRAFQRMIGDTQQVYALGLEHGIDIRDSIAAPGRESLGDFAPWSSETQKAPAAAGAFRCPFDWEIYSSCVRSDTTFNRV
ncbi:hypothetical protein [Nonomuraea cavernae]|uniref:Uncharacterized protein n=1 Tax=Nonomuraea cavernae TaxID=2045107 RepID=A0A918DG43_9ACTN|nr:hypothetical protein [Nonomuraea cavernae]MCA2184693.1 hypothetical protein [Nonomuraea cavernae]GGO63044.1 hypothetical protein GCM10012289_09040 [Nonomuraea cavernae]